MTKLTNSNKADSHKDRILSSVSASEKFGVDSKQQSPIVARSWQRCVNQHNISPERNFSPLVLEQRELCEYQDAFSDIHELARNSVDKLYALIADIGYTVLLTDNNGITLDCRYDPECERELKKQGLYTGTDWSEKIAGTNGIGTCVVEEASVIIRKEEHFFPIMIGMTCIVSPIFDSKGRLIASLDATTLNPETISQNKLISRLVEQYARQIETLYFMRDHSDHWLLRFSTFKDTSDNITAGIIAIKDGVIVAANKNAHNYLCKKASHRINNRAFHEVFDTSFGELIDNFNKKVSTPNLIHAKTSDMKFFYQLNPPINLPLKTAAAPLGSKSSTQKREQNRVTHPCLNDLAGNDIQLQIITKKIKQIINVDLNILIVGETGTGKEAMARAIHDESLVKDKPFIAINCASIPDTLIESELFGYSSGTFTGALKKGMKGKILQANGGTLFLDEIGDMPLHLQTRLLRVLSEMEVVPLGETSPIQLELQLISATNKDISEMIENEQFRSDLYYRLNGIKLDLPSLRNRADKQELIINIFNQHAPSNNIKISETAMEIMINYSWPGNIRQLINTAKYSNAMCQGQILSEEHLPNEIKTNNTKDIKQNIHYSEYDLLLNSLKNNKWNITKVSNQLNICRATVYRKMRKYKIVSPNDS